MSTTADDLTLAGLVLPTLDDLWGRGWEPAEATEASGSERPLDADLPGDFPRDEVTADADVTFERAGGVVHAVAVVLTSTAVARRAWAALAETAHVRAFTEGLAREVTDDAGASPEVELLGPALPLPSHEIDRERRVTVHRALFSAAGPRGVLPLAIEHAILTAGRVVVLAWAFAPGDLTADEGWPRLVERLVLRSEAARVSY